MRSFTRTNPGARPRSPIARGLARAGALGTALTLGACAVAPPTGPTVMALPGKGKTFAAFHQEDAACRQYAEQQIGYMQPAQAATSAGVGSAVLGTALGAAAGAAIGSVSGNMGAGAAIGGATGLIGGSMVGASNAEASAGDLQQRYNIAYTQCMYSQGNTVVSRPPGAMAMAIPATATPATATPATRRHTGRITARITARITDRATSGPMPTPTSGRSAESAHPIKLLLRHMLIPAASSADRYRAWGCPRDMGGRPRANSKAYQRPDTEMAVSGQGRRYLSSDNVGAPDRPGRRRGKPRPYRRPDAPTAASASGRRQAFGAGRGCPRNDPLGNPTRDTARPDGTPVSTDQVAEFLIGLLDFLQRRGGPVARLRLDDVQFRERAHHVLLGDVIRVDLLLQRAAAFAVLAVDFPHVLIHHIDPALDLRHGAFVPEFLTCPVPPRRPS